MTIFPETGENFLSKKILADSPTMFDRNHSTVNKD